MARRKRGSPLPLLIWLGVAVALVLFLFFGMRALRQGSGSLGGVATLKALPTHQITPFGNGVLYYDGMTLTCANKSGNTRWSFQVGGSAGFHTDGDRVVAWSANQLYIFDHNGRPQYNDQMSGQVQFARVGTNYVAAFVGESDNGSVQVLDKEGRNVDNMQVESETLLDIGFFTSDMNEIMWVMGLDTNGTVPSVTLQTYRPGTLAVGSTSLGEQIVYRIFYHNAMLHVVDTWQIRTFDYKLKEDTADTTLIYGWYLQDSKQVGRDLVQLLVQTPSSEGVLSATDIRIIQGSSDKVLHLPTQCFGAGLGTKAAYGFSTGYVYACNYGSNSFTAHQLPVAMDKYLGMIDDNCAILASGPDIYLIQLP